MKKRKFTKIPSKESTGSLESKDSEEYDQLAGELLNNRYILLKFISYGTFSNVYLSYDITCDRFVVLKIQNTDSYKDALDEFQIMKVLCKSGHPGIIQLLDSFSIEIDSETHFCFVLELLGPDIYTVLNEIGKLDLSSSKKVIKELAEAIDYITKQGYIHTDLKPENIMISQPRGDMKNICSWFRRTFSPKNAIIKLKTTLPSDFNTRTLNAQKKYRKLLKQRANKQFTESIREPLLDYIFSGDYTTESDYTLPEDFHIKLADFGLCVKKDSNPEQVQTRNYRAPEVLLENPLNEKIDIWSIGCITYELLTGNLLFEPEQTGDNFKADREHLSCMFSKLGKMPLDLALDSELSDDLFDSRGRVKGYKKINYQDLTKLLQEPDSDSDSDEKSNVSQKGSEINLSKEEAELASGFIRSLCAYYPKKRPSVSELLQCKWLQTDSNSDTTNTNTTPI